VSALHCPGCEDPDIMCHGLPAAAPIAKAPPDSAGLYHDRVPREAGAVRPARSVRVSDTDSSSVSDLLTLANRLRISRNALAEIRHRSLTLAHAQQVALEALELLASDTEKGPAAATTPPKTSGTEGGASIRFASSVRNPNAGPGPGEAGTSLTNEQILAMDPRAQEMLLGAVFVDVPCDDTERGPK
jgi:hypothetical protein